MKRSVLVGLSIAFVLSFVVHDAKAQSKSIPITALPLENAEDAAVDLIYNGKPLDPDRAVDLRRSGLDLATLEPQETDVWQARAHSLTDEDKWSYPADGARVDFHGVMPNNPSEHLRVQVAHAGAMFRLRVTLHSHSLLARAALLRKLGYTIQSPKHYSRLTVVFADKKARDSFLGEISVQAAGVDHERWAVDKSRDNEVVLQDVVLEPAQIITPTSFYVGNLNATHIKGRRTLRALLVPFVLLDVPESVNMFSWEAGQIVSENVVLTHNYADAFSETTLDDARWVLRRLATLTREDFKNIIAAGRYPPDIAALILEKTIARRNSLMALFRMQNLVPNQQMALAYFPKINVGWVVDGKATKEKYEGYAQRFTHGDPNSPITRDEVFRFLKIEALTGALKALTFNINSKLEFWSLDQVLVKRSEDLRQQFLEHFKKNPFKPYSQPISTWHGPTGNVTLRATRNIVTGSYFGDQSSDFKVQLVDQVSAGARVGYFLGVDGVPNVLPGIGANLFVQRSFVHVRPIPSIEAGSKKAWDELWVPGFMKTLAGALDNDIDGKSGDERDTQLETNVKKFLEDLKEGETFTITDSISLSANAQATLPLTLLLGMDAVGFSNSIVFGANGNTAVLRRTTFKRDSGKIKIYLSGINTQQLGVSFDFNWWMNILSLSHSKKWGQAKTLAYHLDERPSDSSKRIQTVTAIRTVLAQNNSEYLEETFFPFELNHATEATITKGKFLFHRWSNLREEHRVKVRPPRDPEKNFDPAKFERTLYSFKFMERTGNNYQSFLSDVIDGALQNSSWLPPGLFDFSGGANPSDSFMGNSRWRTVTTEAEVTVGRESAPVTVSEHYWAGWKLEKAKLFKIFDGIDSQVQSLRLGLPLVDRNVFNEMKALQLYEIRSTLIVYDTGMQRLRDHLIVKNGNPGTFFKRLIGWNEFSGTDKDVVFNVLIPLYGEERWMQWCHETASANQSEGNHEGAGQGSGQYIEYGRSYSCMADWVREVLSLRRQYPADREGQVRWATKVIHVLEKNVDLGRLIKWLGTENTFFQVKVSGFRTNDENGDKADYKSSSIGTFNNKSRAGIFKDFAMDYEITSHELNAAYLSEGY